MKLTIPVVSGGFDPLHSGHIKLLTNANKLTDNYGVVVLLNSDEWLSGKKGKPFMPFEERKTILESLRSVKQVIAFDDSDGSCIKGLEHVKVLYPEHIVVFCNGGDRTSSNIPEIIVDNITFAFGVGGHDKSNSSSWILRDALSQYSEERCWGNFYDLYQVAGCKVKELVIHPECGTSYQQHHHRSELWFVREGSVMVKYSAPEDDPNKYIKFPLTKHQIFEVPRGSWHQIYNIKDENCSIIEIQFGDKTVEDDIERLEYYDVDNSPESL